MTDPTRHPSARELLDKVRSARAVLMRHPEWDRPTGHVRHASGVCDSIEQGLILLDIDIIILQRRLEVAVAALEQIRALRVGEEALHEQRLAGEALNKVKAI
jgi:hypothetical protein